MKTFILFFFSASFITPLFAQTTAAAPPALSSIREADLKQDLFTLASDDMRGRRAGTTDELRAAAWVAEQARKAGLQPAGDDGTWFQYFPLKRTTVADKSTFTINGRAVALWKDAWVTAPVESRLEAPVMWLKTIADTAADLKGKVVAMNLMPPSKVPAKGMSLWVFRYALAAIREQAGKLSRQGVAGVILVADETAESDIGFFGHGFHEGLYQLEGMATAATTTMPVILVRQAFAADLQKANAMIGTDIRVNSFIYPSVNVVAKVAGTDPVLKTENVLFSGHHDHDGIGEPVAGDSIWNGADDNASLSVAMLAIARAWVKNPARRSALFVWHGAEERGLLGSRWYVQHPTVKKESIVAVLNGDMIGRNSPDSAALLGAIAPHRNSTDLVNIALKANSNLTRFKIDTSWDAADHPENWYFRSDHLPYAQAGIPAIFFTTLLHADYHTPRDEPQRIDIQKLAKMTKWMYATGWTVANNRNRPAIDGKQ